MHDNRQCHAVHVAIPFLRRSARQRADSTLCLTRCLPALPTFLCCCPAQTLPKVLPLDTLKTFHELGVEPPATNEDVPKTIAAVEAKKKEFEEKRDKAAAEPPSEDEPEPEAETLAEPAPAAEGDKVGLVGGLPAVRHQCCHALWLLRCVSASVIACVLHGKAVDAQQVAVDEWACFDKQTITTC